MKTTYTFILAFLVLVSCQKKTEIPAKAKLTAKYIAFNDSLSSKIIEDLKEVKEFDKKNDEDKLPFILYGKYYKVETEFKLGRNGKLRKLIEHKYHSFEYSDFGLVKIVMENSVRETLGQKFTLKFSESREQIIDCNDTFKIKKVYPKEKLIFVEKERNDGRVNIYEYN